MKRKFLSYLLAGGIVLFSPALMANKKTAKKKEAVKTELKRDYLDSLRIVNQPKTVTTEIKRRSITVRDTSESTRIANNPVAIKYAEKLAVSNREITNLSLYSFIDSWYGTPYVYGGTSRRGIDCSAFVRELYRNVYNTDILRTSILQYSNVTKIRDRNQLKEGDLIFFNTRGRGVSHVAVYLKNGYFVHSSSSQGVTISKLSSSYWSSKFISGGRII